MPQGEHPFIRSQKNGPFMKGLSENHSINRITRFKAEKWLCGLSML